MHLIGEHIVVSDQAMVYLRNYLESQHYSRVFVLVDENTSLHCLPHLDDLNFQKIEIPSGEIHKNLDTCTRVWDALLHGKADRHSVLINLGGGVIGDLGGFCAATFQRGIDFIQAPTTLLAMVDAAVGGKTGVDYRDYKNFIGVFAEPKMVFIQPGFLDTLPERHFMAGYAEMLKHGLIADSDYWRQLSTLNRRRLKLQIEQSVEIKLLVVEEDPLEKGTRKVLNFGHTLGHAIESFCLENGRDVLHGEAVAAGMFMEAIISAKTGLTHEDINQIKQVITHLYPQKVPVKLDESAEMWAYALGDKKNKSGKVNCTLLTALGKAVYDIRVQYPEFQEALSIYLSS
ncbi:MAG: 3-dehydroquinate synthase [Bacteroidota bacterium]|nr:3-dehydroquinate synthase [Bacteroidota bacterium]MDX5430247.1 3-dehydroquinate synthase [Bacteroidota bacterium]MDX5469008.1 3-dehydroquinate synthase [Bacteroidota bacterium]